MQSATRSHRLFFMSVHKTTPTERIVSLCATILFTAALLILTTAFATHAWAAADCVTDMQGPDDEPGQKDLSQFCEDTAGSGSGFDLVANWNFDDLRWTGSNTGDSCGLFDTNGNGHADFALCVTVEGGPPATMKSGSPKLYTCGDTRPDRCTNAVEDTNGFNSQCTVNSPGQTSDPFASDTDHTSCNGTNCLAYDTYVACTISVADVGITATCANHACSNDANLYCNVSADCVPLTDVCSYPSEQPNSDPSDCIITSTAQDPCKNVDCSNLDDDCNVGVCSNGQCSQEAKADGTACGDSTATTCNGADTCSAGVCVGNLAAEGTACGNASDTICDDPDTCNGSGVCQPNHEPSDVECRPATGDCDVAEHCDGAGSCPIDSFVTAGTACGSQTDTVCDDPDTCDGDGNCQPNHEPATTLCRADAGDCDVPEYCDGNGACPAQVFESAGTPCGSQADTVCDNPDTCNTSGTCLHNYEPNSTLCRADAGDCDIAEHCDGSGSCPADSLEPDGTSCDDGDVCTANDTCQNGSCAGAPVQPALTVIKHVINDNEGHNDPEDFDLVLHESSTETHFRVDPYPNDPTTGSAVFEMSHGASYDVSEVLGDMADYYEPAYSGACSGTARCETPNAVCTITNDDIYHKNQASIAFEWLSVGFPEGDDSRRHLEGAFEITDKSHEGNVPDGFLVLLDDYAIDWQYRTNGDTTFQPALWAGQNGGSFKVNGQWVAYGCTYDIVDIDGVAGNPTGYLSGDPVIFDESIEISYACDLDDALPHDGLLRGIATADVFTKADQIFHIRQSFDLVSDTMLVEPPPPPTTTTSTTSTTTTLDAGPVTTTLPYGGVTTTTLDPGPVTTTLPYGGVTTTTLDPLEQPTTTLPPSSWTGTCWDPNADGMASVRDAHQILRAALGLAKSGQVCAIEVCDQNCDGSITVQDALIELKRAVGALNCIVPAGCYDTPACCE